MTRYVCVLRVPCIFNIPSSIQRILYYIEVKLVHVRVKMTLLSILSSPALHVTAKSGCSVASLNVIEMEIQPKDEGYLCTVGNVCMHKIMLPSFTLVAIHAIYVNIC
jgi:hypothetical protein